MASLPHLNENHFGPFFGRHLGKGAIQVGARVPDLCAVGSGGRAKKIDCLISTTFGGRISLIFNLDQIKEVFWVLGFLDTSDGNARKVPFRAAGAGFIFVFC